MSAAHRAPDYSLVFTYAEDAVFGDPSVAQALADTCELHDSLEEIQALADALSEARPSETVSLTTT